MNRPHTIHRILLSVTGCLLATVPALAQTRPVPPVAPQSPGARAPHQPPCWQQVGITKAAMDQRRSVEQNTRAQVDAVCADPSLTVQQKRAKIKEIHQQSRQEIEGIITPQQLEELKACNAERAAAHPAPPRAPHPGGPTGPCGELATNSAPAPGQSGGTPAPPPPGGNATPERQ